jgi:hypothetical protein
MRFALAGAGIAAALTLLAAQRPTALAKTSPGLWEISGIPGAKATQRQCIADLNALIQFEHRGRTCTSRLIDDGATSTVIEYNCGSAGFGRSKIDVLTPRSLRIDTQGISQNLPFGYVLQAHRIEDCAAAAAPSRH